MFLLRFAVGDLIVVDSSIAMKALCASKKRLQNFVPLSVENASSLEIT
jgi:hypothetical protein